MTRMIIFACALLLSAHPASAITVVEAVEAALKNNPDIQSIMLEQGAAQGRLDQAGLWLRSNPVIEGSLSRKDTVPGGGEKVTNHGFTLSQEFEIAGQRGWRVDAARSGMEKAAQDIRDRERVLIAEVKDAFVKALAAKRKVELADEAVHLQEQLVSSAMRQIPGRRDIPARTESGRCRTRQGQERAPACREGTAGSVAGSAGSSRDEAEIRLLCGRRSADGSPAGPGQGEAADPHCVAAARRAVNSGGGAAGQISHEACRERGDTELYRDRDFTTRTTN